MQKQKSVYWNLKSIIKKRGLTYTEFGELFEPKLEQSTVSSLVRKRSITFEMLERIINALDLSQEEILELIKVYE